MMRVLVIVLLFLLASCKPEGEPVKDGPVDLVIMITGLGSSAPGVGEIWRAWAKKAAERLEPHPGVETMIVSADGVLELTAKARIEQLILEDRLDNLIILSHSNGFRDGLYMAEWAEERGIHIDYFAGIDMTLGPGKAVVTCNIRHFDEFHAMLLRAKWKLGCTPDKMIYHYWRVDMGHTAAANSAQVQDMMHNKIMETINANRSD